MRVVLVEDHTVEREALAQALAAAGFEVVGEARSAPEAMAVVDRFAPDVVLLDLRLSDADDAPDDEGLQVAEDLRATHPDVGLLVLSMYAQAAYAQRLLDLPVGPAGVGYLLKGGPGGLEQLVDAIRRVSHGEIVLDPVMIQRLLSRPRGQSDPLTRLSPQELRVLTLIAEGRSNLRIAQKLDCQLSTIEKHASNIFGKLGLSGADVERRGHNARVMATLTYLRHSGKIPRR